VLPPMPPLDVGWGDDALGVAAVAVPPLLLALPLTGVAVLATGTVPGELTTLLGPLGVEEVVPDGVPPAVEVLAVGLPVLAASPDWLELESFEQATETISNATPPNRAIRPLLPSPFSCSPARRMRSLSAS